MKFLYSDEAADARTVSLKGAIYSSTDSDENEKRSYSLSENKILANHCEPRPSRAFI